MSDSISSPPGFSVRIMDTQGLLTAKPDQPLLLSALAAGHALPGACRNGVCRSCICRLHSGSVTYRMPWPGLSAEEKADGLFLPCVAYPASDLVMSVGEA
jgi:ferredoxin